MAALGLGALPVVRRGDSESLERIVTQFDLVRTRDLLAGQDRS
jgi:hypothetical protein